MFTSVNEISMKKCTSENSASAQVQVQNCTSANSTSAQVLKCTNAKRAQDLVQNCENYISAKMQKLHKCKSLKSKTWLFVHFVHKCKS